MSPSKRFFSLKAFLALVFYLIIPLGALLILQSYHELSPDLLYTRVYWVIPTATVITILAQLSTLYERGDRRRFLLNIGFTVATMIWMVGLLGGGLVITTQWNEHFFSLHMQRYVVLIVSVATLNIIYFALEWRVYREDTRFLQSNKI